MRLTSSFLLRWSWLLSVALLAPAALPAGGADRRQPQLKRRSTGDQRLTTLTTSDLFLSPISRAPHLRTLAAGTPLRLLRGWTAEDGQDWLHVQELAGRSRRGWLRA